MSQKAFKSCRGHHKTKGFLQLQSHYPVADPVAGASALAPESIKDKGLRLNPEPDPGQVLQALSQAAAALAQLANALSQGSFPSGSVSLPPPLQALPAPPVVVPFGSNLTITELVNEFLLAKARAGRSDRYLRALRNSLSKFNHGRGRVLLSGISPAMVEAWLNKSEWAARTKKGYLSDLRVMLSYAVKRGYLERNPAAAVECPCGLPPGPPAIHSPAQVAAALEFARSHDPNLCRALAIRYFAGLRSSEVERLAESEINLAAGHIEVTARKAKTRRRRLVVIPGNLAAWLALGGNLPVRDSVNRWRAFTAALSDATGIPWPGNVARHSFISYHVAAGRSAAGTALEAGNSEAMVFAHYRAVVTAAAASEFFSIVPKTGHQADLPGFK